MKVIHTIILKGENYFIVRNESDEFGINYDLYHEKLLDSMRFATLERALDHIKFLDEYYIDGYGEPQ